MRFLRRSKHETTCSIFLSHRTTPGLENLCYSGRMTKSVVWSKFTASSEKATISRRNRTLKKNPNAFLCQYYDTKKILVQLMRENRFSKQYDFWMISNRWAIELVSTVAEFKQYRFKLKIATLERELNSDFNISTSPCRL